MRQAAATRRRPGVLGTKRDACAQPAIPRDHAQPVPLWVRAALFFSAGRGAGLKKRGGGSLPLPSAELHAVTTNISRAEISPPCLQLIAKRGRFFRARNLPSDGVKLEASRGEGDTPRFAAAARSFSQSVATMGLFGGSPAFLHLFAVSFRSFWHFGEGGHARPVSSSEGLPPVSKRGVKKAQHRGSVTTF